MLSEVSAPAARLPGLVQTGLYCDFFYHYYESKKGGMNKAVKLPV